MCEHYVARAAEPFHLVDLWPFTERLERFGIAGFGWGAAWVEPGGRLGSYRDVRAFRDDESGRRIVGDVISSAVLVHLRRPSKLSTLGPADTQPFDDPAGRFAFSHNGDLRDVHEWRRGYQAAGRICGRADTEVGQRWLEDEWGTATSAALLARLHETMGGQANLAALEPSGRAVAYAGNTENPVFTFRLGRIAVAATGIYSLDRSLFRYVAPEATERRLVRVGRAVTLDRNGGVAAAS
jgi:glutamine phosphoribosylpyrophosphate amidotransferase